MRTIRRTLNNQQAGQAQTQTVLNPVLYAKLQRIFPSVRTQSNGLGNLEEYIRDPITGRLRLNVSLYGETYLVSCPFCNDDRHRLGINHTYGTLGYTTPPPELAHENRSFLWRCYHKECQRTKEYRDRLEFMLLLANGHQLPQHLTTTPKAPQSNLTSAEFPGQCLLAIDLDPIHPMLTYFSGRGISKSQLVDHDVRYCADAESRVVKGRAILPIYMNGTLRGWQARYLGDLDWKASFTSKYYNLPGMPKSELLYNYDRAVNMPNRPYVVITEGVTACWAVGPYAISVFGKSLSETQLGIVLTQWKDKPIFVYLDGNAAEDANKICERFRMHHKAPVIDVRIPPDMDPGDLGLVANYNILAKSARENGVAI